MNQHMYNVLPLFKSHYSLGRSILTLDKPFGKIDSYPVSIFDLLLSNQLNTLVLVDDNVSGLLQASKQATENKIKLVFGLRINVCDDITVKDESSLLRRAKYIIFAKNPNGYKTLIKIWSFASQDGFYYSPCIDFKTLKAFWTDDLILTIPFYDSFLYLNCFCSHAHIPDIVDFRPVFLLEDNELPFDLMLKIRTEEYCAVNGYETMLAQSIFYKSPDDYLAYVAFRCLHNRGFTRKATLEAPELDHMNSNTFNFDRWLVSK